MDAAGRVTLRLPRPSAVEAVTIRPSFKSVRVRASVSGRDATGEGSKPSWAGGGPLSNALNLAIRTPLLFDLMKVVAKNVLKTTAEKKGVPWNSRYKELEASEAPQIKQQIVDPTVEYPTYYKQQFHGYTDGNLNWEAAFEAESATEVMAVRTWKDEDITREAALERMKTNIMNNILEYCKAMQITNIKKILDVGCSVGVSTRWLAETFPSASITGMDLSPYFLSVAELQERQRCGEQAQRRIMYKHGNGESTGLPSESMDLVNVQYTIHECPAEATTNIVKEAWRLLRQGGVLILTDQDPRSRTLQNLPPALFILLKSTEPWADQYMSLDLEGVMESVGFKEVTYKAIDPRHRSITGVKR